MLLATVLILIVLVVAYAAFSLPVLFQFRCYCGRVANATDRVKELRDQRFIDDGGNNTFEREQWWKLVKGEFKELTEPSLVTEAEELSKKVRRSLLLAIGYDDGILCRRILA